MSRYNYHDRRVHYTKSKESPIFCKTTSVYELPKTTNRNKVTCPHCQRILNQITLLEKPLEDRLTSASLGVSIKL